jgi:hypothetical protein
MKLAAIALSLCSILNFATPIAKAAPNSCAPQSKTFSGPAAKNLTQAMMFAGVMPANSWFGNNSMKDGAKTLQSDSIICSEDNSFDDGVARFGCRNLLLTDNAESKILTDAMIGMGVVGFAINDQIDFRMDQVSCSISIPNSGKAVYQCTVTANFSRDCDS